ncbi:DUF5518 domain-containing protein [Haloarcula nitratireducens]|uniref:DUF5518 domain-containing protein n=1 Tax=Haloarcula nitratireducens TaxID=2487749 RepID=A0AAW4PDD0_9EURY|nr:DUF5518 domain-containing protein [Halomicroarcula nitratireducens]MBX0295272.1 DUF5518 domain-containing protein [Halomicroarcula nitratireducens]
MTRIGLPLPRELGPTWKYALLGGLPIVPLSLWRYWQSETAVEPVGLCLAALIAGYLAKRRGIDATPVGVRAGVTAAVPVTLWAASDMAGFVLGLSQPAWFTGLQILLLLVFVPLSVVVAAFFGGLSARIGGWFAERAGRRRQSAVGG